MKDMSRKKTYRKYIASDAYIEAGFSLLQRETVKGHFPIASGLFPSLWFATIP